MSEYSTAHPDFSRSPPHLSPTTAENASAAAPSQAGRPLLVLVQLRDNEKLITFERSANGSVNPVVNRALLDLETTAKEDSLFFGKMSLPTKIQKKMLQKGTKSEALVSFRGQCIQGAVMSKLDPSLRPLTPVAAAASQSSASKRGCVAFSFDFAAASPGPPTAPGPCDDLNRVVSPSNGAAVESGPSCSAAAQTVDLFSPNTAAANSEAGPVSGKRLESTSSQRTGLTVAAAAAARCRPARPDVRVQILSGKDSEHSARKTFRFADSKDSLEPSTARGKSTSSMSDDKSPMPGRCSSGVYTNDSSDLRRSSAHLNTKLPGRASLPTSIARLKSPLVVLESCNAGYYAGNVPEETNAENKSEMSRQQQQQGLGVIESEPSDTPAPRKNSGSANDSNSARDLFSFPSSNDNLVSGARPNNPLPQGSVDLFDSPVPRLSCPDSNPREGDLSPTRIQAGVNERYGARKEGKTGKFVTWLRRLVGMSSSKE